MARKLQLTLSCGDYEITRPLKDGSVEPDGIELTVLTGDRDRILRDERRAECDVGEFNIMEFFALKDAGHPLVALPVFPHRRFRHGFIFVNPTAGHTKPEDLIGGKIGIAGRRPAAAIWIRGQLNEFYSVTYDSVTWVQNEILPGYGNAAKRVSAKVSESEESLLNGEIDAFISARIPVSFLAGDKRIARLFPDHRTQEVSYYEQTGIFPIMHTVLVRQELTDKYPWIVPNLARAFQQAKELAFRRVSNPRVVPLAFFESEWERQRELMGDDPWAYGLTPANVKNLETAARYAHEQGLTKERCEVRDAFADIAEITLMGGTTGN